MTCGSNITHDSRIQTILLVKCYATFVVKESEEITIIAAWLLIGDKEGTTTLF